MFITQGIGLLIFGIQYKGDHLKFSTSIDGGLPAPITLPEPPPTTA